LLLGWRRLLLPGQSLLLRRLLCRRGRLLQSAKRLLRRREDSGQGGVQLLRLWQRVL
jgi:hypothetical protein